MSAPPAEARNWGELSAQQKKSGLAAWLGWMFDGLDMHIYTLVALPFVAQLMLPWEFNGLADAKPLSDEAISAVAGQPPIVTFSENSPGGTSQSSQ